MTKKVVKKPVEAGRVLATSADAVLAIAMLTVLTDRKLHKKEAAFLKSMLGASPLFRSVADADSYISHIAVIIADTGADAVLDNAVRMLNASLRETAYAWAVCLVASDGKFVPAEHAFLGMLKKKLGLHGVLAGKIKAVVPMLVRVN